MIFLNELVRKAKMINISLPFGSTALVVQHMDKRLTNAHKHNTSTPTEPKTELGVCLGPHPTTSHTMFVLANGRIVPRRAYLVMLVPQMDVQESAKVMGPYCVVRRFLYSVRSDGEVER